MITLSCDTDVQQVIDMLGLLRHRQMPFAAALALNWTARDARQETYDTMERVFDRPTPTTMRSVMVKPPATKNSLTTTVWLKDFLGKGGLSPLKYLHPQVHGGPAQKKRSEGQLIRKGIMRNDQAWWPDPIGVDLDAYGNVPGPLMVKILSQIQAFGEQGYRTNETAASREKRHKRDLRAGVMSINYFVMWEGHGSGRRAMGVYMRRGFQLERALSFIRKPQHNRRLPFYELVNEVVRRKFNAHFQRAFAQALATAR